jgi:hypothetical protein
MTPKEGNQQIILAEMIVTQWGATGKITPAVPWLPNQNWIIRGNSTEISRQFDLNDLVLLAAAVLMFAGFPTTFGECALALRTVLNAHGESSWVALWKRHSSSRVPN